ncbi:hypothetical protein ACJX0J_026705, partial [Zea mays]
TDEAKFGDAGFMFKNSIQYYNPHTTGGILHPTTAHFIIYGFIPYLFVGVQAPLNDHSIEFLLR